APPEPGAIVHIPRGVSISYGAESAGAEVFFLQVDGALRIASDDGPTDLTVDTLVTGAASRLELDGTSGALVDLRIAAADTSELPVGPDQAVRRGWDDGAGVLGRHEWDPEQLSLGVMTHGSVRIAGAEKVGHIALAETVEAGDRALLLDLGALGEILPADPAATLDRLGWAPGDRIAIGSTAYTDFKNAASPASETEERTIVSVRVEGDRLRVELDAPLAHDHQVKRLDTDLDGAPDHLIAGAVANLSRSVQIRSTVATSTDESGRVLAQTDGVNVKDGAVPGDHYVTERGHVMFMRSLDIEVENALFAGLGRTDKTRNLDDFQLSDGERVDERPDDAVTNHRGRYALHLHRNGVEEDGDKAALSNNLVWGSPGWGLVQHDASADLIGNVAYQVVGAGFVSETGNERGVWRGNLALDTVNPGPNAQAADVNRSANQDFGSQGVGFWLESRLLTVEDNLAQGASSAGFQIGGVGVENIPVPAQSDAAPDRDGVADGAVDPADAVMAAFRNNTAIGTFTGLWLEDGQSARERGAPEHDLRTWISGFAASEVERSGVFIQDASQVTVTDTVVSNVIRSDNLDQSFALGAYKDSVDIVFDGVYAEGADPTKLLASDLINRNQTGDSAHAFIDVRTAEPDVVLIGAGNETRAEALGETARFELFQDQRQGGGSPDVPIAALPTLL
ncbi:MAG: hypothetical protein AAFR16_10160, partial [Pseudomonadota bacterium]